MPEDRQRGRGASEPPPRPKSADEAYDRLQALETRLAVYEERTDQRLNTGAATMGELKSALSDLKPKRQALIPWAAVALAIGGIVFRAGNYPDRQELDQVSVSVAQQIESLRGEVRSLERELIRWRAEREAQEARTQERLAQLERQREAAPRRVK